MTAPFVYDGAMNRNVSLSYVEQRATTIAALWGQTVLDLDPAGWKYP